MMYQPVRGFTLLISIILTSVLVSVGIALIDLAYKQLVLASTARQSEVAFYAADTALECALYWDQKQGAFSFTVPASSITCNNQSIALTTSVNASTRTTTFTAPCAGGGTRATVTVYKNSSGSTAIYSNGYSSCSATDPRRIERGLKVTY